MARHSDFLFVILSETKNPGKSDGCFDFAQHDGKKIQHDGQGRRLRMTREATGSDPSAALRMTTRMTEKKTRGMTARGKRFAYVFMAVVAMVGPVGPLGSMAGLFGVPGFGQSAQAMPVKNFTKISGGYYHSLALASDGTLWSWGDNLHGQLGNGTNTNASVPTPVDMTGVLAGKTITAVATGYYYSMVLDSDGAVYTWGHNATGQLGNNSTTNSKVPVAVTTAGTPMAGKTITAIAGGGYHALALASDSTVYAWGQNTTGTLGNNSTTDSKVPVAVTTAGTPMAGKTITAISGSYNSLALASDGTIYTWGRNDFGQLGNNSTTNSKVPVAVSATGVLAGKTVTAISAGAYHSLALTSDGKVYSWGRNESGGLGNNSLTNSSVPVAVTATGALSGKAVSIIAAGYNHSTVLASDGKLYAWGLNSSGQFGNGTAGNSAVPVAVTMTGVLNGKTVTAITGNGDYTLAKTSDNALYSWGLNDNRQLGNNSTTNSTVPVQVLFGTPSAPNNITTTVGNGSLALTWKKPIAVYGQAVTGYSLQYRAVGATTWATASVAGDVTSYTLGSLANGTKYQLRLAAVTVVGVGDYSDTRLATPHVAPTITSVSPAAGTVAGGTGATIAGTDFEIKGKDVVQVAGSRKFHSMAVTSDGKVYTWGLNDIGQLGNNSTTDSSVPVAVTTAGTPMDGKTIVAVTGGWDFSLALASDGTVYAWGQNAYGQLGNNSTTNSSVPVAVTTAGTPMAGKTIIAISSGYEYSLALASDGTVYSWGNNNYGQLGNNSNTNSSVPVAVTTASTPMSGKTITAIAVGGSHPLVLASDGTVYAWGYNNYGQLGNNSTTDSKIPVAVTTTGTPMAGKTITNITASGSHSLVLASDGTIYAWGYNGYGLLGNNSTTQSTVPVAVTMTGVLADKTITDISASASHSLALASDGTVYSWGRNLYGELGNNSTTQSNVPVAVNASGNLSGKTITAIAASAFYSLALASDGTIYSWGLNDKGQLGNGTTTDSSVPVAVNTAGVLAGKTVMAISRGWHSLALGSDGAVYSWGQNTNGQLGNNSTTNSSVPVAVSTSGSSALAPSVPAVTFDGTPATGVTVVDRTTITATTPAHATGTVDVVANLGGGDANYQATRTDGYTYAEAPGAPTAMTATPADNGVDLSWTAPAANGAAITDYVVQYSPDGGATWATYADGTATGTTATVPTPTLNSTTEYTFRVAAVNAVGQGVWSNTDSARVLYITLTAPSSVAVNVTPMGGARMSSSSQNIVVSTNGAAGYRLTLNSATADRDLAKGSSKITPVAGTQGLPINLTGSTWGYRVDGVGGFGATTTAESNTTASAFGWAGIPDLNSPEIIRTQTSAVSNQTTTVWYGVNVEEDKPSGLYAGTVTYTAVTRD